MTFKSTKGEHTVTINGNVKVFSTLAEAIKHIFEVRR